MPTLGNRNTGPVGFDSLPTQLNAKSLKRGFEFNLMIVGETGLGKSTMVDTLFNAPVSRASANTSPAKTLGTQTVTHGLFEFHRSRASCC